MMITTKKENALRRFKVSANTRLNDPFDFSTKPQPFSNDFNVRYKSLRKCRIYMHIILSTGNPYI